LSSNTDDDLASRGYTREQIEEMLKAKRSNKNANNEVLSLNIKFKHGVDNIKFPQFNYIYTMYSKYEKYGVLPFPGSLSEQPAKIIEIFGVINAIEAEEEKRLNKK
jgi:hypothetical protein